VDTDAKKAEFFRKGLTIQLQDRLILSQNLSYNGLASAAIDQEGTMKACDVAEGKKRKRVVSGPSEAVLAVLPEIPHDLHPTRGTAAPPSTTVLGQSPTTAVAAVQPCSASTTAAVASGSQATTTVYACRLPVLQLQKNRPLRQGLSSAQAGQCTSCSGY
jgi:hypothetical protein